MIEKVLLPDYAVPAFVDREKYYFGSPTDVDDFLSVSDEEPGERVRGILLHSRKNIMGDGTAEHVNIYGFSYIFSWDTMECEHIWAVFCNRCIRCVKVRFKGLLYTADPHISFSSVTDSWGLPGIIRFDGNAVFNSLYEPEKVFSSEEEAEQDFLHFDGSPVLTDFFNDILGDG